MPSNANFSVPFLPQSGIPEQIMTGIKNAHDIFNQMQQQKIAQGQLAVAQQSANTQQAAQQSLSQLQGAQTGEAKVNTDLLKAKIDMFRGTDPQTGQNSFDKMAQDTIANLGPLSPTQQIQVRNGLAAPQGSPKSGQRGTA